tara:strand:+ start:221 stop:1717 length:1497 start_codon:yes stop_codon:yes gene_type:complete
MKKLLGIIVLGLLWCTNGVANDFKLKRWNVPSVDKPWIRDSSNNFSQKRDSAIAYDKELIEILHKNPDMVQVHPGAEFTPGIPSTAATFSKEIRINLRSSTEHEYWISTGLYASAGEKITATLSDYLSKLGLKIQIGAHVDGDHAYAMKSVRRFPFITYSWPLNKKNVVANSAFGGLIYIVVPGNLSKEVEAYVKYVNEAILISGAYLSPRYVHGKTKISAWIDRIRDYPAPWAELESDKVILTVPSHAIKNLNKPDELMNFWSRAMDAAADLASISRERKIPVRYVTDPNWEWGAHSGYPIMMAGPWYPYLLNHKKIGLNYWWGTFHELGHNHQMQEWIWQGWAEVSCNLWSVYILETVAMVKREQTIDGGSLSKYNREIQIENFIKEGRLFSMLQKRPILALEHLLQLEQVFGWELFIKLHKKYRLMPENQKPKTDNEKIQQFIIYTSEITGSNLISFYKAWGFPIDDWTINTVNRNWPNTLSLNMQLLNSLMPPI